MQDCYFYKVTFSKCIFIHISRPLYTVDSTDAVSLLGKKEQQQEVFCSSYISICF